jgi:hypothetical protein
MPLTTAQRIAAVDTAVDAWYTALAANDGQPPLDIGYFQDPDGGQVTFRKPAESLAYIAALEDRRQTLVDRLAIETAGGDPDADEGPIVLVRRRT